MSHEKVGSLVRRLAVATQKQGNLWERTTEDAVFQASFPGYSVRLARAMGYQNEDLIILSIFDEDGALVEQVDDSDLNSVLRNSYQVMLDLYEAARRQAMGVEQALDTILEALGEEDPEKEEDLPF